VTNKASSTANVGLSHIEASNGLSRRFAGGFSYFMLNGLYQRAIAH